MNKETQLLFDYFKLSYVYAMLVAFSDDFYGDFYNDFERETNGFFFKTFKYIKYNDEEKFKKLTRFSVPTFDYLLSVLKERLTKHSFRPAITAECRLAITVIYLAHGDSRNMLCMSFRTSPTSLHRIIYDTCESMWEELHWLYVGTPNASELKNTARHFYSLTGLPHCVGAIDGKHVNIICPPGAGSEYYNYKGQHSIVLLAACDANYSFTFVDIGARGSESDGGVFSNSIFGQRLMENTLNMPDSEPLPGSDVIFPYFFVADAAFPLRNNIMKPYPGRLLAEAESRYNYKISSARRLIENTFGIMCARWRIMNKTLHCKPKNAEKIVKAVVTLHNFAKFHDATYSPPTYVDHEENGSIVLGEWRREMQPLQSARSGQGHNARREAFQLRDKLKEYLNSN